MVPGLFSRWFPSVSPTEGEGPLKSASPGQVLVRCLMPILLISGLPRAQAVVPLPPAPLCGSVPDQNDASCPNDLYEDWRYISYVKDDYKRGVRPEEWALGSGIWLDRTLATETGDFGVVIAVLDSGIKWDAPDLVNKHFLNPSELPLPQDAVGNTLGRYDRNNDGIFNIRDYAEDPRVSPAAGVDRADSLLDPSDLIYTFSDGLDQDGNGYTDDIAGWDFFWNDNDPYDTVRYGHGTAEAEWSAAEGGNGDELLGTCPSCSVMNLRVGDSFISEVSHFAEAVLYAVDTGALVVQEALGTINNSELTMDALAYAHARGVTVVASNADETSIHQNAPANNDYTLVVHSIRYDADSEADAGSFLAMANCTNFGGNLALSVPGVDCSSEATGRAAGVVGLIYSAALRQGLTLTANEVWQLTTSTADDIDLPETYDDGAPQWYPSQPGWEAYFGYGRLNAFEAVRRVQDEDIPPEAWFTGPRWFEVLSPTRTPQVRLEGYMAAERSSGYTWSLEVAAGLSPLEEDFMRVEEGAGTTPRDGLLAQLDLRTLPPELLDPGATIEPHAIDDTHVQRVDKINRYTITVRLRVIDHDGRTGEARRTLYVQDDPDLLEGFPYYCGGSLESSPKVFDLDGDGRDEVLQATSDGRVHALRADGSTLSGWPVRTRRMPSLDPARTGHHSLAPAFCSGAVSADRGQAIVASLAVGDLDGDGWAEVVAATFDGEVYAWRKSGTLLTGFPITLDFSKTPESASSPGNLLEPGFFSSPALGDLNQDGRLDIVVGGMDQWVYAWDHQGKSIPGWPVLVRYVAADGTSPGRDRILNTPALGDLDNNGTLDVVIGTNEIIDSNKSPIFAIHGEGNLHPDGPFMSGWPVLSAGLFADVLPVVGRGTTCGPVLADVDGDRRLEVAGHTVTGYGTRLAPSLFRFNGKAFSMLDQTRRGWGGTTNTDEPSGVAIISTGSFGDIDQDGEVDYVLNLGGFRAMLNLMAGARRIEHNYLIGAWNARTGRSLVGFPQQEADMQFFMNPAIADLDDDGLPEVISGSGAFTLNAFNRTGVSPAGWPKFTGQWNIASPAVGDLDGDGFLELVQSTRSGWIYVWRTGGRTPEGGGTVEWASFHHDLANTGNYQTALPRRSPVVERRSPPSRRSP